MVAASAMNLKTADIHELEDMVDTWPWFSAARQELVGRMARLGGDQMDQALCESALFFYSRAALARYAENSVAKAAASMSTAEPPKGVTLQEKARAAGYVLVGGDYFSKSDLDNTEKEAAGQSYYERFRNPALNTSSEGDGGEGAAKSVYTETLAEIYAKQGLTSQAIEVYSKLILLYPEKSTYFASLIENLKQINN